MAATIISSKFEDVCAVCLGVIAVGDRIAWKSGDPARHADCAPVRDAFRAPILLTHAGRHYHASATERSAILRAVRDAEDAGSGNRPGGPMVARRISDVDMAWIYADAEVARNMMRQATERRTLDGVRERAMASIR